MNRHYYISNDLDELENVESELKANGIAEEQMHVLSEQDAQLDQRHLHEVPDVMRKDLVRGGKYGLGIGVAPLFLLEGHPGIVNLSGRVPELDTELWMLSHADVRHLRRVKVFFDFLRERLQFP